MTKGTLPVDQASRAGRKSAIDRATTSTTLSCSMRVYSMVFFTSSGAMPARKLPPVGG